MKTTVTPHEKYLRKQLEESVASSTCYDSPVNGELSFTQVLCFILGWQGGTIHQVAKEINVAVDIILNADYEVKQWLCRIAQLEAGRQSPDPLDEALNSGDGSYKP